MDDIQLKICFANETYKGVDSYKLVNENTLGLTPKRIILPELNLCGDKFDSKKHLNLIKEFEGELRVSFESEDYQGPSFSISYPGVQSPPQVFTWSLPLKK
ncbi:hypothetical protein QQ008_26285 [Fulvivirgaceae bacterium BMA10]|uniref:Uncharacterized protein n=1 Tax=Splendidivirga corallicola TaxID=3051826 RepID=A0ABT8KW09_9BACT|nr:hypothetical protein [Fulvivirgaceae bacterium BMA10]